MGAGASTVSTRRKKAAGSRGRERYSKPSDAAPKQSFVSALVNNALRAYSESKRRRPGDGWGLKSRSRHFIDDNYNTVAEVATALKARGLDDCNLIVGIDFTKSNEWTGKKTFGGRCLHTLEDGGNPYEQALEVIADTLHSFDSDQLIPCYGFGDASTKDTSVFSFVEGDRPCYGLNQAVEAYRSLVAPTSPGGKSAVRLAGPTSFAPLIRRAMDICASMGNRYHVLLIIADGQVTPPSRSKSGGKGASDAFSQQEKETVEAIVAASYFPLSIVMVGVGDGPWDMMKEFDDNLPMRAFDNFQFVEFAKANTGASEGERKARFALSALMEIPEQYRAIQKLGYMNMNGGAGYARMPQALRRPVISPMPPPEGIYMDTRRKSRRERRGETLSPTSGSGRGGRSIGDGVPSPGAYSDGGSRRSSAGSGSGGWSNPGGGRLERQASGTNVGRDRERDTWNEYPPSPSRSAGGSGSKGGRRQSAISRIKSQRSPKGGVVHDSSADHYVNEVGRREARNSDGGGSSKRTSALERKVAELEATTTCSVCLDERKDTAFSCGHQTCHACAEQLVTCPTCREFISVRIRLFN